ncbi:MAG: glycosyltransferase, partial [Acidobacteria bacterium]
GLVMIEALACGTPVVAFRGGSVDEVIESGTTGFVVDQVDQAIDAALRIHTIDRRVCRQSFERRFTAERMASDYLQLYRTVRDRQRSQLVS